MFCLYRLCLLFTIVKLGQGSGVWSESQPVQNFEVVRDDYLSREKSLWQLIRSKGDKKEYNAEKICDTHKQFMGINFGEIGLLRSVLDDDQLSRANRSVIDSILNINRTFDTGYELLYNGMYDRLPAYTDDVLHRFTSYCNEAKKTIVNHEFWNSVKNVCTQSVFYSILYFFFFNFVNTDVSFTTSLKEFSALSKAYGLYPCREPSIVRDLQGAIDNIFEELYGYTVCLYDIHCERRR